MDPTPASTREQHGTAAQRANPHRHQRRTVFSIGKRHQQIFHHSARTNPQTRRSAPDFCPSGPFGRHLDRCKPHRYRLSLPKETSFEAGDRLRKHEREMHAKNGRQHPHRHRQRDLQLQHQGKNPQQSAGTGRRLQLHRHVAPGRWQHCGGHHTGIAHHALLQGEQDLERRTAQLPRAETLTLPVLHRA